MWQHAIFPNASSTMTYNAPNTNALSGAATLYFSAYNTSSVGSKSMVVYIYANGSYIPVAGETIYYTDNPAYYYVLFTASSTVTSYTINISCGDGFETDVYISDWSIFVGTVGTSLEGNLTIL